MEFVKFIKFIKFIKFVKFVKMKVCKVEGLVLAITKTSRSFDGTGSFE
jgi:hypothetical protein